MVEKVEGGGGEWDKLKDRIFAKDNPTNLSGLAARGWLVGGWLWMAP